MLYSIKIEYTTGDSFSSAETSTILEGTWTNIKIIKRNLLRIQNHYKKFIEFNQQNIKEWLKDMPEGCVYKGVEKYPDKYCLSLELLTDNGDPWVFFPYWCGYFESLHSAEIIYVGTDTRIEF